jgi:hypothetical protein
MPRAFSISDAVRESTWLKTSSLARCEHQHVLRIAADRAPRLNPGDERQHDHERGDHERESRRRHQRGLPPDDQVSSVSEGGIIKG